MSTEFSGDQISSKLATDRAHNGSRNLYERWRKLMNDQQAADRKLLELISHPKVTDEQIVEAARARAASHRATCETQFRLYKIFQAKGESRLAQRVADDVGGIRLSELPPPSAGSSPGPRP